MAERTDPRVREQLDAIEAHMDRLEFTTRLLLADRLIRDGHAPDWNTAMAWSKDLDRVRRLYPEARRG